MKARTPVLGIREEGASSVMPKSSKGRRHSRQPLVSNIAEESISVMPDLTDTGTNMAIMGQDICIGAEKNGEEAISQVHEPVEEESIPKLVEEEELPSIPDGLEPGDYCECCRGVHDENKILLCDGCDRGWHLYCLVPKKRSIPKNDWFCTGCKEAKENPLPAVEEQAPKSPAKVEYSESAGEQVTHDTMVEIGSS